METLIFALLCMELLEEIWEKDIDARRGLGPMRHHE